jgi:hypothetical protein
MRVAGEFYRGHLDITKRWRRRGGDDHADATERNTSGDAVSDGGPH